MHNIVKDKLPQLVALCKKYSVVRMYLFGSAARGDFDEATSDIDLLYTFNPELDVLVRGENFFELHYELDDLFGRKVDLVSEKALENPYFIKRINQDKQLIYGTA